MRHIFGPSRDEMTSRGEMCIARAVTGKKESEATMANLIGVTLENGESIYINADQVQTFGSSLDGGTRICFDLKDGTALIVREKVGEIMLRLKQIGVGVC